MSFVCPSVRVALLFAPLLLLVDLTIEKDFAGDFKLVLSYLNDSNIIYANGCGYWVSANCVKRVFNKSYYSIVGKPVVSGDLPWKAERYRASSTCHLLLVANYYFFPVPPSVILNNRFHVAFALAVAGKKGFPALTSHRTKDVVSMKMI